MSDVQTSWARIIAWCRANAPATAGALTQPSGDAEITAAETEFGERFPDDLRDFFRHVGGITDIVHGAVLPLGYAPMSLADSRHKWRILREIRGSVDYLPPAEPVAGTQTGCWPQSFVPIGEDACGSNLFADLRTGAARGCVAEFHKVEGFDLQPQWPGVAAMLTEVADGLENNQELLGCRRIVDDECVFWE